jgi:hypothetical protein
MCLSFVLIPALYEAPAGWPRNPSGAEGLRSLDHVVENHARAVTLAELRERLRPARPRCMRR